MICSISTGKSDPNWLDRLRSIKGFPTGDNLDLDHFLRNNDDDDDPKPTSSESTQSDTKRDVEISCENGDGNQEWLGIMNNVLSDLFNMGGGEANRRFRFSGKKSSRKQTNPKFCLVSREEQSSGSVRKDENAHEENVNNNLDSGGGGGGDDVEIEEDVERGERELCGYSRNEVTVIDTSCVEWKFEKLVYRKRNVWKVREKKGKSRVIGRKKRKGNGSDDGNVDGIGNKKKIKLSNAGDSNFGSKHGDNLQDDKGEEVNKDTSGSDGLSQVPKNRLRLSRLPKKTKNGGSSVILIKGMPTSKKMKAKGIKSRTPELGTEKHQVVCNKAPSTTLPTGKGFGV